MNTTTAISQLSTTTPSTTTTSSITVSGTGTPPLGVWAQLPNVQNYGNYVTAAGTTLSLKAPVSMNEFLAIDDKDLQKYIFLKGDTQSDDHINFKIDNEEKIGYYTKHLRLRQNLKGDFYVWKRLTEWIVYNKKTKKTAMSSAINAVFNYMIGDIYRYTDVLQRFWMKPTKTLCKQILTGKINSVYDLMKYHRSYTFRNKNLSPETLYLYFVLHKTNLVNLIEDPENLTEEQIEKFNPPHETVYSRIMKIHSSQINDANGIYDRWFKEQSEKYAALRGTGSKTVVDSASEDAEF